MNCTDPRTGLAFCALGQPCRIATRCALMQLVHSPGKDTTTGIFSAISMMDLIGGAGVHLLLGQSFQLGLHYGGAWTRLQFFVASFLLAVVAALVFSANVTPQALGSSGSSTLEGDGSEASTLQPATPLELPRSPVDNITRQDACLEI